MVNQTEERVAIRARRARENVIQASRADAPIVMAYPSPYRVGMSSLGFLTLHRQLNAEGPGAHRAFLPDAWEPQSLEWSSDIRMPLLSYEQERPISSYPIVGISVAYELEVTGLIRMLEGSGIPLLAADRTERDPIIIIGGPLTNSNPSVILPFADLVILGEAEQELAQAIDLILDAPNRRDAIESAATLPHTIPGEIEPGVFHPFPTMASAPKQYIPAHSGIVSPDTELANMFLVEPSRGCSRRCTFCVMRGETTGGMRLLDLETPLSLIPDNVPKVGLVGAAVTDHPKLEELVARIVEKDRGVGISSLRADRLTPELLRNLSRGGYRTITVASDGISERMRLKLDRKITEEELLRAAKLIREHDFHRMKVYQMIGGPTETDADVDELIRFTLELAKIGRTTLTFSTFVAKRNTPLDRLPFVGIKVAEERLRKIRDGLKGKIEMRPQPPKWAYVEYELAQRGPEVGHASIEAVHNGGRYSDWKRAFKSLGPIDRDAKYGNEERLAKRKGTAPASNRSLRVL